LTTSNTYFLQLDAFDIGALLKTKKKFNKIFIDLSGNREPLVVMQLIESYEKVFKPDMIVVKNYKLKGMIARSEILTIVDTTTSVAATQRPSSANWQFAAMWLIAGISLGVVLPTLIPSRATTAA
jgi:hypothetical protein